VEANSTEGQGSRRAIVPIDDDDDDFNSTPTAKNLKSSFSLNCIEVTPKSLVLLEKNICFYLF
jgi:hypothetical protein